MALTWRLDRVIWWFWLYIAFFTAVMLIFRFWSPTAANFEHTYQLGTPPGTLRSQRWSWLFVREGLYVLLWLVPLSAAFMIGKPGEGAATTVHIVLLLFLGIWFLLVTSVGIHDWATANPDPTDPADAGKSLRNPATDLRWCCVYFGVPGVPCINTAPCNPAVGAADLTVDPSFLFTFWYGVVLLVLMAFDFFFTVLVFVPESRRAGLLVYQRMKQQQQQQQQQEKQLETVIPMTASIGENPVAQMVTERRAALPKVRDIW